MRADGQTVIAKLRWMLTNTKIYNIMRSYCLPSDARHVRRPNNLATSQGPVRPCVSYPRLNLEGESSLK
jgi:hypothetical protein